MATRQTAATATGEHFRRGGPEPSSINDFEEALIYAAVAAHDAAGGTEIPRIPEQGVRVAMQINGVEVSARHFIAKLEEHFVRRNAERTREVQKEAATLVKGRVRRLVDTLHAMERTLQTELIADFPDMANAILEED